MFNPHTFENSRSDGFPVMEVADEDELVPRQFVPLRRTELSGTVTGPLADFTLVQNFGYTAAQCDRRLEALYRFPLPGDAAVTGVTVRFGEVEISAELKERARAEAEYDEAKRTGRQAALATRESPDVFTLHIAGLKPNEDIRVETSFVQLARSESGAWTLRIPLTTAPRYVREDESNSRHAVGQPLALLRDPGHRFSLDLRMSGAEQVESPTHTLASTEENGDLRIRLEACEVIPDRDCLLTWRTPQEAQHPALHLHLHEDIADDSIYFLALIAPPKSPATSLRIPRESILLVDHSGSMHGPKWAAADWAVKQFLQNLQPGDTMALGLFHDSVRWFTNLPKPAEAGRIAGAIAFLERNRDSGGTNLGVALEQALAQDRSEGELSRHILILTDAEVSDAGRLVRLVESESHHKDRRRVSVLCIDAAPNAFLAREIAERGGGISVFLTSEPEEEDVTTALDRVLEDWQAPVYTDLRLEVSRAGVESVGHATVAATQRSGSAIDVGDLPAGRAVWIAGRVPRGESPDLSFRLVTADGKALAERRCDLRSAQTGPAVKALFGTSRVMALEFLTTGFYEKKEIEEQLKRLGYNAKEMKSKPGWPAIYAENKQKKANEALRALLVREALRFGIACSETAFIATRKEAGELVEGTTIIANALPAGWSDDFAGGIAACRIMSVMSASAPAAASSAYSANFAMPPMSAGLSGPAQGSRMPFDFATQSVSHSPPPPLFAGTPVFNGKTAILYDSTRPEQSGRIEAGVDLTRLTVRLFTEPTTAGPLDNGISILIYVDDMASARARVKLADILKQSGVRPLNVHVPENAVARIVLEDPNGAWRSGDSLEVTLE